MRFLKRHLYILLATLILLTVWWGATFPALASDFTQDAPPVYIYFFWGDGCPHCADAKPFLQELAQRYPNVQVESFEVWYVPENQTLFQQMAAAHGFEPRYVPTIFIGEQHWEGFSEELRQDIETAVGVCAETGCPDAGVGVIPGHELQPTPTPMPTATPVLAPASTTGSDVCAPDSDTCDDADVPAVEFPQSGHSSNSVEKSTPGASIKIPLLGDVDLGAQSLWVSTALIAFVDGFNPCSLWVLSILIALTLRTGSRKKIFIIGLTFITVTALVYVLFIAGLFTMLTFVRFLGWIQAAVSLLALFFAVINIKDYFWYKEGLSFTIDDAQKPGLYKRMRRVMQAGDSLGALLLATVGLGLGVSLVEFSCTAGFPVLWTNLVTAQNVAPLTFALLLLLYMLIYQIDELAIFMAAVVTLRASKLEEKHGRILKLIGGTLMLTLAAVMLFKPALMNDMLSSVLIFGAAFGAALLVLLVHRVILPRFGIVIGTEALD